MTCYIKVDKISVIQTQDYKILTPVDGNILHSYLLYPSRVDLCVKTT